MSERTDTAVATIIWVNSREGKTQRLSGARLIDEPPRNASGKVLKRALRPRRGYAAAASEPELIPATRIAPP